MDIKNLYEPIILVAATLASGLLLSCNKENADLINTLSVSPSETVVFEATGNNPVEFSVETNASSWSYDAPDWIEATQKESSLVVNALDNSGASRAGRIVFTAGNAERQIVSLVQKAADGVQMEGKASLVDVAAGMHDAVLNVTFTSLDEIPSVSAQIKVVLDEPAVEDITITVDIDPVYLNEYILSHDNMECYLFPEEAIEFSSRTITIPAGKLESDPVTLTLDVSVEGMKSNSDFLVPVYISSISGTEISEDAKRVNYIVRRTLDKQVRNLVYFEVNDTNPLNALEYLLEDGTPFFDAVVIFSGNINYDQERDEVYLNNNPNVAALLNGNETYIQPLREKGIKVYLGILGNHDAAGVAQLSTWGAQQFSIKVADAVLEYGIDGVNLDDEWSTAPGSGDWFAGHTPEAGSRLCYELTQAMDKAVPWETEVSVFAVGAMNRLTQVDGHNPGEFVDFWVGNYGTRHQ